jgi:hypothetical protein
MEVMDGNIFILNPIPHEWGYVSDDDSWMAVPFGNDYMVIKNDQQIKSFKKLNAAKKYIQNQIQEQSSVPEKSSKKRNKKEKVKSTLEDFM